MTAVLLIFATLILLILFILYVNVHIIFVYGQKATVTLRILFVRMDAMKLFQHFTREKDGEKKATTEKCPQKEPSQPKEPKQKGSVADFMEFLLRITRIVGLAIKEHFSKMKIYLKELSISIATDDAAKTALLYGGVVNAANGLCVLLQRFSNFRCDNRNLIIAPDYTSEKSRFSIHLDLTVKPIHVIAVLIRAYFRLLEGKDVQHARNSVKTGH